MRSTQCFITRWNTSKIVKNTCWCCIFNSLLGFSSGDETRRLMLDILLESLSLTKIKFNVFFLIEVEHFNALFLARRPQQTTGLAGCQLWETVSEICMLVTLMSAYTNFFFEKGKFLQTFKAEFLLHTCSDDCKIDRLICYVIRQINSGTDYWDFMHAYPFLRVTSVVASNYNASHRHMVD